MCLLKLVIICTLNGYFYQTYLVKRLQSYKRQKKSDTTAVYVHTGVRTMFIHLSYVNAQNVTYFSPFLSYIILIVKGFSR